MLDWLIIGGGLHGTHLALVLVKRCGVAPEWLRILDPHETLLAYWERCTTATGMTHLRSTIVHHLALDPHDLWNFAQRRRAQLGQFLGPYRRPALGLFRDHCQALIAEHSLDRLHLRGRATGLTRTAQGWSVETDQGSLAVRRVLLALSVGEQPRWPDWAAQLHAAGGPMHHLYGCEELTVAPAAGQTVVVGGGISAAQVAVALARAAPGCVTLLMRHEIRVESFDSPPGWVGPKELRGFHAEPSVVRRRAMIAGARRPGSMPEDVARTLRRAEAVGMLRIQRGEVRRATFAADGAAELELPGLRLRAAKVLLATGFEQQRPGGAWLDQAIAEYELPLAPCGYPLVAPSLAWAPGLYVTGGLAELELGPVARNIVGARHAGERLRAVADA
ncbi:MAG: FAD/NAD(P)-binding protein [Chloroflexales bacterium]|nr:FAD/NAD(P)-binding protein [Chloroflexales bacterium]